jgi:hypothetical protein
MIREVNFSSLPSQHPGLMAVMLYDHPSLSVPDRRSLGKFSLDTISLKRSREPRDQVCPPHPHYNRDYALTLWQEINPFKMLSL